MSIPSGNPLNYPPGSQSPIKRVGSNRAPTSKDAKNFREGDEWLDRSSNDWYKLAKNTPSSVIWARIGGTGGPLESFIPDSGTSPVIPDASNQITIAGTNGISTSGSLNTITITGSINSNIVIQSFNANDTYTPTAGMTNCIIECVGGGGGGGGINNSAAGTFGSAGSGGGGEYVRVAATAAEIGASQPITGGTAGGGGAAGVTGSSGGPSSVGTIAIATGGNGGAGVSGGVGGLGGTAGTGDFTLDGGAGGTGDTASIITIGCSVGQTGGSYWSPTSAGKKVFATTNGDIGPSFGGGGEGGASFNAGGPATGADGAVGLIVITEWIE